MKALAPHFISMLLGFQSQALTGGERLNLKSFESSGPHLSVVGFAIKIQEWNTKAHIMTNYCSGTILGPQRILTAAHCVSPIPGSQRRRIRMHFGPEVDGQGLYDTSIQESEILLHPKYNWKNKNTPDNAIYDLAILQLAKPLPALAKPLALPNPILPSLQSLILIGYGTTQLNSETETSDDWGHLRIAKSTQFQFQESQGHIRLNQKVEAGLCKGDSGSPALVDLGDSQFSLVGVAHTVEADLKEAEQEDLRLRGLKTFLLRHAHIDFCKGYGYFIDIRPHLDWIRSLL